MTSIISFGPVTNLISFWYSMEYVHCFFKMQSFVMFRRTHVILNLSVWTRILRLYVDSDGIAFSCDYRPLIILGTILKRFYLLSVVIDPDTVEFRVCRI